MAQEITGKYNFQTIVIDHGNVGYHGSVGLVEDINFALYPITIFEA